LWQVEDETTVGNAVPTPAADLNGDFGKEWTIVDRRSTNRAESSSKKPQDERGVERGVVLAESQMAAPHIAL
jgi:hypothetical protein